MDIVTARFQLIAGCLVRRKVRAILDFANVNDLEVDYAERRGLLDSIFSIKIKGEEFKVMEVMRTLGYNPKTGRIEEGTL